jgi:hypothetical protein
MASGFQQDTNQLAPNFYRVTIDLSSQTGGSAYYPNNATLNTSGGIEPFDANGFATLPTSNNNSIRRARGNIRWNNIIAALSNEADCQILDVTASNSGSSYTNANTVSDALAFTVKFERDDFLLQRYNGTTDAGSATITTVAGAVKEIIARAIAIAMTRSYRTASTTQGEMQQSVTVAAPRATAANAYTTISVSKIETTTTITSDYP